MRKIGWISAIAGAITSLLGVLGAFCLVCAPVCGVCVVGIVSSIFGIGTIAFLAEYNVFFIIIGCAFLLLGLFLILKRKKVSCECSSGAEENSNQ